MRVGFFAYPWDLMEAGPERVVPAMATEYGCNALTLNVAYHHARLLRPRAGGKTWQLPGAVAAFAPDRARYSGDLRPVPDPRLVEAGVVLRTRAACAAAGLDCGLWLVGLHNSTLGASHPELCLRNCLGDSYTYSLCPAQAAVQAYLGGLVVDVCRQFQPQRLLLEAIGYLSLRHGVHHELIFARWSEPLELLFSLCFCPACLEQARAAGIDGAALQDRVAGWVARWLDDEPDAFSPALAQAEVGSLLVELPELTPFLRQRSQTVSALVADLRQLARAEGVALEVIPASFHRPASRAWLEGASLTDLGQASDGLLVPTYHDSAAEVAADLWWVQALTPEAPLAVGLNACSPSLPGGAALVAQAQAGRAAGCVAVTYYNYGLLSQKRLAWVRQANASLLAGE